MRHADTIVIGGGLAGLAAALVSAKKGKRTTLLTYGAGSLSLNSGVIDILGYDGEHTYVASPRTAIDKLPPSHPYRKIGMDMIEQAVKFFLDFTAAYHFPYRGSLDGQILVPTAVGTMKPTGLAPQSLIGSPLAGAERIAVVAVKGLKDFYGNILADNLPKSLGGKAACDIVEVDTGLTGGRDITTLDVARWLDTQEGFDSFLGVLKPHATAGTVFLVPQVLGTDGEACARKMKEQLGADIVETTCLPPSVNGMRLQKILRAGLKDLGVEIIEDTKVLRPIRDGRKCRGVVAQAAAREKEYYAEKFILATGGFYSGGIAMREFEHPQETVFDLPVWFPEGEEHWSNEQLFSDKPQGFAQTGILTDESLRPVDGKKQAVYENVYIVGRNLGGYDFCFEHSGNGVALASAYKAALM